MIARKEVKKAVKEGELKKLISTYKYDNRHLKRILRYIGRLPSDYNSTVFKELLDFSNDDVRFWAVKNIGKCAEVTDTNDLFKIATKDDNSMVRREAVSSIGRMRDERNIEQLVELLSDNDPKVVLQAIRGLLPFKKKGFVKQKLKSLESHPNELIRRVLDIELNGRKRKKKKLKHSESSKYLQNLVVKGDTLEVMKEIDKYSVHLTFTSPPYYNARDYSIYKSYEEYLDFLTNVFKEVHRITKEGRFFILNTSPIIIPRFSRKHSSTRYPIPYDLHNRIVDLGWEFIDDIIWKKPESSAKDRNGGFKQHRKPLAYKTNAITECLMVYRKKTNKLIDWNIRQYDKCIVEKSKVEDGFETTNVWELETNFDKNHSAVFPQSLCERVIKYYSFINDLVFDPFAGSGTLGVVAKKLNRKYLLTEVNRDYANLIKQKLVQEDLFNKKTDRFLTLNKFKKNT